MILSNRPKVAHAIRHLFDLFCIHTICLSIEDYSHKSNNNSVTRNRNCTLILDFYAYLMNNICIFIPDL